MEDKLKWGDLKNNDFSLLEQFKTPMNPKKNGHLATGGLSYFYLLINGGICDLKRGLVVPLLPVHELSCGTIKNELGDASGRVPIRLTHGIVKVSIKSSTQSLREDVWGKSGNNSKWPSILKSNLLISQHWVRKGKSNVNH